MKRRVNCRCKAELEVEAGRGARVRELVASRRVDRLLGSEPFRPVAGRADRRVEGGVQLQHRIVFDVEDLIVSVGPKPVLVGIHSPQELVEHDPGYGVKRDIYEPGAAVVGQLRNQTDDVRVRIYFGNWCPFCGEMVPRVLKIDEALQGSNIRFEYYGLPRSISDDPEARSMNISGVPTGVVYRGGKEIGRVSGNSWRTPEQALADILN